MVPCRFRETDRFVEWLSRLNDEAHRMLRRSGRPRVDHDDIVGSIVLEACERGPELMHRYPSPERYARVRTGHAAESHYRKDRAQRGAGARLVRDADGTVAAKRTVVSLEAVVPQVQHPDSVEDEVVAAVDAEQAVTQIMQVCATRVSRADLETYVAVRADGTTVTEVAGRLGLTRETTSRRISRLDRTVREVALRLTPPV